MVTVSGKKMVDGVAIGTLRLYRKEQKQIKVCRIADVNGEIARYEAAREKAVLQLRQLYDKALGEVGESNAEIFEMHSMMLEDQDFNDFVYRMIREKHVNAEYAAAAAGENFSEMFSDMEGEYFQARSIDVKDISDRLIAALQNDSEGGIAGEPAVIMAEDFTPSETVQMDRENLLAFVTHVGSENSHTAILARTMNIPALAGIEPNPAWDGKTVIVDGGRGELIIDPEPEVIETYRDIQRKAQEQRSLLEILRGKETVTLDGKKISLYANIGNVSDLEAVLQNDAEGIGLFRSEFLYLEKKIFPTEEEQFEVYKKVAETMAGRRVVIRTMDIGADKQADYFHLDHEENPAMGYRAIRICLEEPEIFKTQLRAIFRAGAFGNIAVMYPMITSLKEVRMAKAMASEVKKELAAEGISVGEIPQGIMIETPAAAVISDILAPEADFFSIGTNDLTQYTLAVDRQNEKLDAFYDPHHPAILRLIGTVVKNAHQAGIPVGICGELGADASLTRKFLEMGLDEISVAPGSVLGLRKIIRETRLE